MDRRRLAVGAHFDGPEDWLTLVQLLSQSCTIRRRRAGSAGFTLMEVLIALAIAGISLAMLTAEIGTGLNNAKLSEQYIEAVRRAQSRLEIIGAQESLDPGETKGDDGDGFYWQARISAPVTHPPLQGPDARPGEALYDIEVTVNWQSGDIAKNISLWSQRLRTFSG